MTSSDGMSNRGPTPVAAAGPRLWRRSLAYGLTLYLLTSCIALLGVLLGLQVDRAQDRSKPEAHDWIGACGRWDGRSYAAIITEGYSYCEGSPSLIAFFPLYPLLGEGVVRVTHWRAEAALLLVSHACLAAAFVVMVRYVRLRQPDLPSHSQSFALLAFGLLPTTFFFRMAYTESLFVLLVALALYWLHQERRAWAIAAVTGLATATRPVGIALVLPLLWYLWERRTSRLQFVLRAGMLVPVACAGLVVFMAYQQYAFGDALAFAKTQAFFRIYQPVVTWQQKLLGLASWEPIWSLYDPNSPAYWGHAATEQNPLLSLHFANPIYFLGTAILVVVGAYKRWLSTAEWLLCAGLLAIPYVTRGMKMCMASHGRFAAIALPAYVVAGRLLARLPLPVAVAILGLSAFLGAYSAMFAREFLVI